MNAPDRRSAPSPLDPPLVDDALSLALLDLARRLALDAGRLTLDMRREASVDPDRKSSVGDLVTVADRASEALIVSGILSARPDDAILGEEGADRPGTSGFRWIIDPIDGTTNYVYDLPGYTISVAVEFRGTTIVGVVYDPKADECFAARRGNGATLDDRPIACSTQTEFDHCVLGTGFGYQSDQRRRQAEILIDILPKVANLRRLGSAALDLAYVGAGRIDGYWESGLNAWDAAAGALIAGEAGATVTDLAGNDPSPTMTVAAPPTIHTRLVAELRAAGAASGPIEPPAEPTAPHPD